MFPSVIRRLLTAWKIRRLLRARGVPTSLWRVFTGDVIVTETVYDQTRRFADFYVKHYSEPNS